MGRSARPQRRVALEAAEQMRLMAIQMYHEDRRERNARRQRRLQRQQREIRRLWEIIGGGEEEEDLFFDFADNGNERRIMKPIPKALVDEMLDPANLRPPNAGQQKVSARGGGSSRGEKMHDDQNGVENEEEEKDESSNGESSDGDEESKCMICWKFFFGIPVVHFYCGHFVCKKCFSGLANIQDRCPMCRKSIITGEEEEE